MNTTNEPEVTPPVIEPVGSSPLALAIQRMNSRTPEQILADRERILANGQQPRPLPEGKTLEEVVQSLWPGDETDEEVHEALERLS